MITGVLALPDLAADMIVIQGASGDEREETVR
ncbi:MAG: hypothetical protein QOH15_2926 [Gaiellales bacterium]|jgi:hypothetical protein|nr:hypothetical protein [Gaiellales bacterium]